MGSKETEASKKLEQIKLAEKRLMREVPSINYESLRAILDDVRFLQRTVTSFKFCLESEGSTDEAGFKVMQSLQDGEVYFSNVVGGKGMSVDLDNAPFPDLSDAHRGVLDTTPNGSVEMDDHSSWDTLDTASLHWHPRDRDGQQTWFNASSFDFKNLSADARKNSLKLRVKSGVKAAQLRALNPPDGTTELDSYIRELHEHYGYFIYGMFAPTRLPQVEKNRFESEYRPYKMVGMPVSESKAQVLILQDNPSREKEYRPEPEIFSQPARDLEGDSEALEQIIGYYNHMGFDAAVVFFDFSADGIEMRAAIDF